MRSVRSRLTRWIGAVAVPLLVVAGAASVPAAVADPAMPPMTTMPSTPQGDGLLPPGNWTPAQRTFLLNLIHETEADLPAFSDPSSLAALGFHNFGAEAPGGYIHYINNSWIDDGHILDPTHPESLLFQETWDPATQTSTEKLVAAMFFLPTGTTMSNIPADLAWIPGWHVHPDICVNDNGTFAGLAKSDGTCFSGHPMTGPPMTHVWIVDNGCGNRFSMVDIGGLMCDLNMPDMPDMPDMPGTTMPMDPAMPMDPTTTVPSAAVKPAAAVAATPTYTG